ncbi:holin [Sphaerisporangium sp. NPDC051011]|uniref:holin n=1 Tax=Sphaerisporangium sp. NPDC051011 TaxID=3155792 RepID=UPI0034061EBA
MQKWITGAFWSDAVERAVRTAAQTAVGLIGVDAIGLADVAWPLVGSAAGLASLLSLLNCIAAGGIGDPGTAGFFTKRLLVRR